MESRKDNSIAEEKKPATTESLEQQLERLRALRSQFLGQQEEFLHRIQDQKDKLKEQTVPLFKKNQAVVKSLENEMRDSIYLYDYLPTGLSAFQFVIRTALMSTEERSEKCRRLDKLKEESAALVKEAEGLLVKDKKLDSLVEKTKGYEAKLVEKENELLFKIFEKNTSTLFQSLPSIQTMEPAQEESHLLTAKNNIV
jgi:hypothetical protein